MAAKDDDEDVKPDAQEAEHSLDMSQAAVKRMIAEARELLLELHRRAREVLDLAAKALRARVERGASRLKPRALRQPSPPSS